MHSTCQAASLSPDGWCKVQCSAPQQGIDCREDGQVKSDVAQGQGMSTPGCSKEVGSIVRQAAYPTGKVPEMPLEFTFSTCIACTRSCHQL